MEIRQIVIHSETLKPSDLTAFDGFYPHLVLVFGSLDAMKQLDAAALHGVLPAAQWVGCSTAGEISTEGVTDQSIVLTALRFQRPAFRVASEPLLSMADSAAVGERLGAKLAHSDLRHVIVFGQGANINGSGLVEGLTQSVGNHVTVTGGLAGDAGRFSGARVLGPAGVSEHDVVALAFDGPGWHVTHGSFGGWQPFGPIRKVTRSQDNVLFELDGERALDIYKRYLGEYVSQLPASGLLFPWAVLGEDTKARGIIRTILGVDDAQGSLILAGDVPQGGHLQLMHATVDALIEAAESAAKAARLSASVHGQSLALLVSCIGRKLVMGSRVDEEVEAVGATLGKQAVPTGFYSNGEISPHLEGTDCKLHNQTMTITLLSEIQP